MGVLIHAESCVSVRNEPVEVRMLFKDFILRQAQDEWGERDLGEHLDKHMV